jgi:hypothetical protein
MRDLRAAREEALLGCDLFNDRRERNLDAFIAHMLRAWLHLLRAVAAKQRRTRETRDWDLPRHLRDFIPDFEDPVRVNVEFFLGLRERIEHRFSRKRLHFVETLVSGKIHALLLNFEKTLVAEFGVRQSLSNALRFPIFLTSLTHDTRQLIDEAYGETPASVLRYIESYERKLEHAVLVNESYDFRIYLMPKASPSERDLPVEFVDLSKLSAEEAQAVENARVIIRDRHVEAVNVNRLKAGEVVARVQSLYAAFSVYYHTLAWRHYRIRPPSNAADPMQTDAHYCVYDRAHRDYLYTEAWVERLKTDLDGDPEAVVASWKPPRMVTPSALEPEESAAVEEVNDV